MGNTPQCTISTSRFPGRQRSTGCTKVRVLGQQDSATPTILCFMEDDHFWSMLVGGAAQHFAGVLRNRRPNRPPAGGPADGPTGDRTATRQFRADRGAQAARAWRRGRPRRRSRAAATATEGALRRKRSQRGIPLEPRPAPPSASGNSPPPPLRALLPARPVSHTSLRTSRCAICADGGVVCA